MVPRGEVGLIVALVGLQMNIVSESAYALVIFMTGITTLVAPPIMKLVFRDEVPLKPVMEERRSTAMWRKSKKLTSRFDQGVSFSLPMTSAKGSWGLSGARKLNQAIGMFRLKSAEVRRFPSTMAQYMQLPVPGM